MSFGLNLSLFHESPIDKYPIIPESAIIIGGLEALSLKTEKSEYELP